MLVFVLLTARSVSNVSCIIFNVLTVCGVGVLIWTHCRWYPCCAWTLIISLSLFRLAAPQHSGRLSPVCTRRPLHIARWRHRAANHREHPRRDRRGDRQRGTVAGDSVPGPRRSARPAERSPPNGRPSCFLIVFLKNCCYNVTQIASNLHIMHRRAYRPMPNLKQK